MPYVNIRLIKDPVTVEQKAELIASVTEVLQRVLNKPPAAISVVIDEIDADNWGVGGESIAAKRRRAAD